MLVPTCSMMISSDEPRCRGFDQSRVQNSRRKVWGEVLGGRDLDEDLEASESPSEQDMHGSSALMGKVAELVQWRMWAGSAVEGDLLVGAVGARRLRRFRSLDMGLFVHIMSHEVGKTRTFSWIQSIEIAEDSTKGLHLFYKFSITLVPLFSDYIELPFELAEIECI
ncbi:unnamed protein product [Triticum turgidum subsp. durum]|uniref:Uncharacterized protein n=1 Tax=Triticum turgidum subsp. durum TaxID=4567 RepID=A0A9R0RI54_TRITD|nr:unnamed protein product [Triticum turgidum subsp. durum]